MQFGADIYELITGVIRLKFLKLAARKLLWPNQWRFCPSEQILKTQAIVMKELLNIVRVTSWNITIFLHI